MRVLISSHLPFVKTGYGIQTNSIVINIRKLCPYIKFGFVCWNGWDLPFGSYSLDDIIKRYNLSLSLIELETYKDSVFFSPGLKKHYWKKIHDFCDLFKCDKLLIYQDMWIFEKYDISRIKCQKYVYLPIHNDFREHSLLTFNKGKSLENRVLQHLPYFDKISTCSLFGMAVLNVYNYQDVKFINHMMTNIPIEMTKQDIRAFFEIPDDLFICLIVANISGAGRRKGIYEQMAAFSIFSKTHPNARLLIHTLNKASVIDNANMLGIDEHFILFTKNASIPDEDLFKLYKCSDVLLHASKSEGFGMVCVGAQMAGLMVITTNCTAMVENTSFGICTEPKSVSAVVQGLNSWSNPSIINIVSALNDIYENNLDSYNIVPIDEKKYDPKKVVYDWIDFLDLNRTTFDTSLGKITLLNNETFIINSFKNGGYWDIATLTKLREYINPTKNILEIGGHCGTSSIIYASYLNYGQHVYVYEPQKHMFDLLNRNIKQNYLEYKVVAFNNAVFCANQSMTMNSIDLDGGGGDVKKRYNEENHKQCNFGGIGLGMDGEQVESITIDGDMKHSNIGFIHCDAQGAENYIFSKAVKLIQKNRPVILYENNAKYSQYLYNNVRKCYPGFEKESVFNLEKYCMETLKYSKVIHRFGGGIDDLLIP